MSARPAPKRRPIAVDDPVLAGAIEQVMRRRRRADELDAQIAEARAEVRRLVKARKALDPR